MGADFCLAYMGIETDKEPDWKKAEELIEKMGKIHLSKWRGEIPEIPDIEHLLTYRLSLDHMYETENEPDMNDRTKACEELTTCLREIQVAWAGEVRDSITLEICGKTFLFSGGMSWGDPPTETYMAINLFLDSGMADVCGFGF